MKKFILFSILLIFICLQLSAQRKNDALYLRNGSIIFGRLMEVANDQYKIRTSDGSLLIFSPAEVERFESDIPLPANRKSNGFGFVLEAGLLAGSQSSNFEAPFSFNTLANFTFNTKDIVGIGSGVEFIDQPFVPFFVEYKRLVSDRKTSPFLFIRGGNLFHITGDKESTGVYYPSYEREYKGGFSFAIGTGISWAREDHENYLSFAYRNAHTSYTETGYNSQFTTYKNTMNRLEIKFGFKF